MLENHSFNLQTWMVFIQFSINIVNLVWIPRPTSLNNLRILLLCIVVVHSPSHVWPHGLQRARPPCPTPLLEVCWSSRPLHWWCHQAISSSDTLFSFCPESFSSSRTFPMSQLFSSGDQNTGASASVISMNIQGWFALRLTGLISLSKGLSGIFSSTTVQRYQFFGLLPSLWNSSHTTWKTTALTVWTFVGRVISLLFNALLALL